MKVSFLVGGLVLLLSIFIGVVLILMSGTKKTFVTDRADITAVQSPAPSMLNDMKPTLVSTNNNDVVDMTSSKEVVVQIKNFEYVPKNIKIRDGTRVTWTNNDDMKHNVMLDHEDSDKPHDAVLGQDPSKFEGPLLAKGESYSFTFKSISDNPYHCSPHPWMKGKVEVVN